MTLMSTYTASIEAIRMAIYAIQKGQSEGAIIITANLMQQGGISYQLKEMGNLSEDGITRPFDENGNVTITFLSSFFYGCVRSPASFLQFEKVGASSIPG